MKTQAFFKYFTAACLVAAFWAPAACVSAQEMDELWDESVVKPELEGTRGRLFSEGNYAMFIHWGLYSHLANKVDGKTYYGIGEWIMDKRMADIPADRYKTIAQDFNPVHFDAREVAALAKAAGMRYIVITTKHHDGFAMYRSASDPFNIIDATPFGRDPMKELAAACREAGLGLGFYYSHYQDWIAPGGYRGPEQDNGEPATFADYFANKCLPQVQEITTGYGPLEVVWFDTPGGIEKQYVDKLVEVVRQNQPGALICGRVGRGMGDYRSLGDMQVPVTNPGGLWETVDTTNDSWAYAWYDENWKTPQEILRRVVATVGRGGTYMLNIGLRGDGAIPRRAADALRGSGAWIARYPQVVYGAGPSPWQHALPWGDVTVQATEDGQGARMHLCVFSWPASGELFLPGLKTPIASARLIGPGGAQPVAHERVGSWTKFSLPARAPESLASVVEVDLEGAPEADPCFGLDPALRTEIPADFASASGAKRSHKKWMEKFGEWRHVEQVGAWEAGGEAVWEVEVLFAGDYRVDLTYAGEGRLVWRVAVEGGQVIQNQQNSSHNYQSFPMGWLNFPAPGRYRVAVSCVEGNLEEASLRGIGFERVP